MCGIAGIVSYYHDDIHINHEALGRMCDHMVKRGPDSSGVWYSNDRRVLLGHRRLSIIDLSEKAAQPMVINNGSLVLSFNGEIYNYIALRKQLEIKGYQFNSDSDTEVILHLYADQGIQMLNQLRGMFALAIWDANKQSMLLARDPFGIKPLNYSDSGKRV